MMLFLVLQMVQCGMGRCGMNSADPRDADEKLITEDEIVPVPKVFVNCHGTNSHNLVSKKKFTQSCSSEV